MEYEFIKDFSSGQYTVQLNSEQNAIARWLNTEVDGQSDKLEALLNQLKGVTGANANTTLIGSEYSLVVDDREVKVFLNASLNGEHPAEDLRELLGSEFNYDESDQAGCGLDDLMQLLSDWRDFI